MALDHDHDHGVERSQGGIFLASLTSSAAAAQTRRRRRSAAGEQTPQNSSSQQWPIPSPSYNQLRISHDLDADGGGGGFFTSADYETREEAGSRGYSVRTSDNRRLPSSLDTVPDLDHCSDNITTVGQHEILASARPFAVRPRRRDTSEEHRRRHPLYLGESWRSLTCASIAFENGMSLEECDELYFGKRRYDYDVGDDESPQPEEEAKKVASCADDESSVGTASTVSMHSSWSSDCSSVSCRSSRDPNLTREEPRKFTVSFSPTIKIRSIHPVSAYPRSVRDRLWHSRKRGEWEKQKNARRRERAHDDGDWRMATEEADWVRCDRTGRWVHPAHVSRRSRSRC